MSADAAPLAPPDPLAADRALAAAGLLAAFNESGVLVAADVHVATRIAALAGEADEEVRLAAALAVRATRLGHVCVDLATIAGTAAVEADETADLSALAWPDAAGWVPRVAASSLVGVGVDAAAPLRLEGSTLYLDRLWREERAVAADLRALAAAPPPAAIDASALAAGVARLFGDRGDGRQAQAAATAVLRRLAVVAGGPGTGKTTTIARIVALLAEQAQAAGRPLPVIALAAPTGKAAARLEQAVHDEARAIDVAEPVRDALLALRASTLHRLLGWTPSRRTRFRHHRGNRLPHDVVIVDETSMVSLSLMARLVEAVRDGARLVLVGDPGQLTSVEAGAVLGDVVGPAATGSRMSPAARAALTAATGREIEAADRPAEADIGDGIVVLDRVHRFGAAIGAVADAVRRGDADAVLAALDAAPGEVAWIRGDAAELPAGALAPVREEAVAAARAAVEAARRGDAAPALAALSDFRLLCAHRRGPHGVAVWGARVERWLAAAIDGLDAAGEWYAGRPLLLTRNDYALRLFNGDTGVVVAEGERGLVAAFERRGEIVAVGPSRLEGAETVHAMTVHKSQGSQFRTAAVVLPDADSPLLTRELLYTAVTRAQERLVVVGSEASLRAAVERPIARASGLRRRLWG